MKIDLNPNELVIKASDSSHIFDGAEVKGKLILTNQKLYFKSSMGQNVNNNFEISPSEIEDVMLFANRILFPTGLSIIAKSGKENKFLVKKREEWNRMIVSMC
jgi:hypothetical protein